MSTSTHFGIKLGTWSARIDEAAIRQRINDRSAKALGRIGAILMRGAQKKIKRRVVTQGMIGRLQSAERRGNRVAARRILQTIQQRQMTVSAPGQPPVAHVPDHPVASIRAIYFAVMPRLVLVGPVAANMVLFRGGSRSTVPELLEKGGTAQIAEVRNKLRRNAAGEFRRNSRGEWRRRDLRRTLRPWEEGRTRTANYAARPFMGPTLIEHQDKIRSIIAAVFRSNAA